MIHGYFVRFPQHYSSMVTETTPHANNRANNRVDDTHSLNHLILLEKSCFACCKFVSEGSDKHKFCVFEIGQFCNNVIINVTIFHINVTILTILSTKDDFKQI